MAVKIEIPTAKARAEKTYEIKTVTSTAKWMVWRKVAINGRVFKDVDEATVAIMKMPAADKTELARVATTLANESHAKKLAKQTQGAGFYRA